MTFRLRKWYCDCVSVDGDVFLGYWAKLSWGPFCVPYASVLYRPAHAPPRERFVIRSCPPPAMQGDTLDWSCPWIKTEGRWHAFLPPCHRTLLDDAVGSIVWRCHVPAATTQVQIDRAVSFRGLGYAEELMLSVKPSRLPFDELHWGRFVSNCSALTWIRWKGVTPSQWVFHNGVDVSDAVIDTRSVRLPEGLGVLELGDPVTLRAGSLADTALRGIPAARRWLLPGVGRAHETKWLSKGTLTTGTHSTSGWVIYEVVRLRPL